MRDKLPFYGLKIYAVILVFDTRIILIIVDVILKRAIKFFGKQGNVLVFG